MATRTFIGTIDGDWQTAGNWLEGAVPVDGDDVIFDASSPNCTLSANAPASGKLKSLICTNYTNTLNLNGYTMYVGQGALAGTILDVGANSKWGAGTIELYTTATGTNYNIVQGRNNINFNVVNIRLAANGNGRYIDIQSHIMIGSLIFTAYSVYFASRAINIYVYGNIDDTSNYNVGNTSINLLTNSLYIIGGGKTINCYNSIITYASVYIQGTVSLLRSLTISLQNYNNINSVVMAGNYVNCNGYDLIINIIGYSYNHDIDISNIDSLIINFLSHYNAYIRFLSDITINKKLIITETIRTRSPYNIVRSATPGTKVNITLGNDCKYMLLYAKLQDIHFNKPVKGFYCSYTNCDNITSGEYPEICVNVY